MNNRYFETKERNYWDLIWLAVLLVLFTYSAVRAENLSGRDIMIKHEAARKLPQIQAEAVIVTGGGGKKESKKEFKWWRKLQDGDRYSTLTRFLSPSEVRDQAILFKELADQKNDVQMYLPAYKKVRRVESGSQSGSFMGSEFSYSDISTPDVDDYKYEKANDEACPVTSSVKCFVLLSTPANSSVQDKTGIKSAKIWVRQDSFMIEKVEYTDLQGTPWKRLLSQKIETVADGKFFVSQMRMENLKTGRYTELVFSGIKTDKAIPDRLFTVQNLRKL